MSREFADLAIRDRYVRADDVEPLARRHPARSLRGFVELEQHIADTVARAVAGATPFMDQLGARGTAEQRARFLAHVAVLV